MNISAIDYIRYVWQMLNGYRTYVEQEMLARRHRDIEPYLEQQAPLRVLDLANGRLRPQYTLLKAQGHDVYGIDLVNRPSYSPRDIAYMFARRLYRWKLGIPILVPDTRTLVCGKVEQLPFPDNWYDLVTSVAAFEHFLNVPAVVADLFRVLRPGGVAWISIHPFTCLSGGHNISFAEFPLRSVPAGIDVWDHLRARKLPFFVPLNEWSPQQYLQIFASSFEILNDYCALREGEELLTPEVEMALAGYSRDELTCGAYVIVARKPY
jgi:SAM-dependent methyltransferase